MSAVDARYSRNMRIVELDAEGPQIDRLYTEILQPAFPPDELCTVDSVQALAGAGRGLVWAALDDAGQLAGVAVGEWDPGTSVMLLSWLAVRPGLRGGGIGGPLLDAAMADWRRRYDPCLILAEVEDPERHHGSEDTGDPVKRLRFYQRRGARALDLPYFQAALAPEKSRVRDLLLMVLHADPSFTGDRPDTIRGPVLRTYIEAYQRVCEGAVATDEEALRLYAAIDQPGGVPLLPAPEPVA